MKATLAILTAAVVGSVLLQGYLAIWQPSSFGRFAEFPVILLYAALIALASFILLVVPGFSWLRRSQRSVSTPTGFLAGLLLGCLVMLLFMALSRWPVRVAELVAGSVAGAVGVSIYARLVFKRVG